MATALVEGTDPVAGMDRAGAMAPVTAMGPTTGTAMAPRDLAGAMGTPTVTAMAPPLPSPSTCARSSPRC
ncbi:hypothetical protein GCM10023083_46650 [Streptomyces phyllanthi]